LKVSVDAGSGTLTNNATISSSTADPNAANNTPATPCSFNATSPHLTIGKTVDKATASPGDTLTYTISYQNTGNASASGVSISDALPAKTSFVSASAGGTLYGGVVTWTLGSLAAGGSGSVTLTVKLDAVFPNGT